MYFYVFNCYAWEPVSVYAVDYERKHSFSRPAKPQAWEIVHSVELTSPDPDFGGLSAMALVEGTLFVVSDRGKIFQAGFQGAGNNFQFGTWYKNTINKPFSGFRLDPEALTILPGNRFLIGNEGDRSLAFIVANGEELSLDLETGYPNILADSPINKGIEGLTRTSSGMVIAISEGLEKDDGFALAMIDHDLNTSYKTYVPDTGKAVSDLSSSNSTIFVLERGFNLLRGWHARIASFDLPSQQDRDTILGRSEYTFTRRDPGDNFEGLIHWQAEEGQEFLAVISDDNQNGLQRTLFVVLTRSIMP